MSSIKMQNVSKKIKNNLIVNEINLEIKGPKIIGIRGINGSGKTMLMRLIAGLILPTAGEITVDGHLLGKEIEFPQSIGFLIENPAFLGSYSGLGNLKILASIKQQISQDTVLETLARVGLDYAANKKYRKYSLGMKQRLGIAAAIMERPQLILLDEPTNALDETGIAMVQTILEQEKKRGATILVACHDSQFLDLVSDEIYCLQAGGIQDHLLCREAGEAV